MNDLQKLELNERLNLLLGSVLMHEDLPEVSEVEVSIDQDYTVKVKFTVK